MLEFLLFRGVAIMVLILANGFFVAAELSLVSVRETRIEQLIAQHKPERTTPPRYIFRAKIAGDSVIYNFITYKGNERYIDSIFYKTKLDGSGFEVLVEDANNKFEIKDDYLYFKYAR